MTVPRDRRTVAPVTAARREILLDIAICAVLVGLTLPVALDSELDAHGTILDSLLLPAVVLGVPLRRRRPLAAAGAFAVGCVISAIPTFDQFRLIAAVPAALLISYALGTHSRSRSDVAGLGLIFAGLTFEGTTDAALEDQGAFLLLLFAAPPCVVAWVGGRMVAARQRLALELAARSAELEDQRDRTAALAVEIERERLATDVDIVARVRLQEIATLATAHAIPAGTFARIEGLGREALDEMRGLLGALRSAEHRDEIVRPSLDQLAGLVDDAHAAGRRVAFAIEGERRALVASVELAAYRTVQHALVAVDDAAAVTLRYGSATLEIEVSGPPAPGVGARAARAAARERVVTHGGSFHETADTPDRLGLIARLPLTVAGA
jgi:signal transduction histidine kinase